MSVRELDQVRRLKLITFIQNGRRTFFRDDVFKVRLAHLRVSSHNSKEGKCGAAFSDCSWTPKSREGELRNRRVKELKSRVFFTKAKHGHS